MIKKKRPAPQRWVGGNYQEVYTEREIEILTHEWTFKQIEAAKKKKRLKASITSNKTLVPLIQCVSIFKHRGDERWQNRFDSQFTCNISDSSTPGSCRAVLLGCCGKLGRVVVVGGGVWPSPDAPLIDQSQTGCQSPQAWDTADKQQLSVSMKASPLCVLIGNNLTLGTVIKMPIYKRLSRRWWSLRDACSMDLLMQTRQML